MWLVCKSWLIEGPSCVLLLRLETGRVEGTVKSLSVYFCNSLCYTDLLQAILVKNIDLKKKDDVFPPSCKYCGYSPATVTDSNISSWWEGAYKCLDLQTRMDLQTVACCGFADLLVITAHHLSLNHRLHTSTVLPGVVEGDKQPCLLCVLETFPAAEKPSQPCMGQPSLCWPRREGNMGHAGLRRMLCPCESPAMHPRDRSNLSSFLLF